MGDIVLNNRLEGLWLLFVRRIGFTASLEDIFERTVKITDLISKDLKLNLLIWRQLAKHHFNKKNNSAADEMLNPYNQLDIITKQHNKVYIGKILESLIILRRIYQDDDEKFRTSVKHVLLSQIIFTDGETFLNILAKDFDPDACRKILTEMVEKKFAILNASFKLSSNRNKQVLWEAVKIRSNKKSKSPVGIQDKIGDDFLRHTLSPRVGWAESMGLFKREDKRCTDDGLKLINTIRNGLSIGPKDPFIIFPNKEIFGRHSRFLRSSAEDIHETSLQDISDYVGEALIGDLANPLEIDLSKKLVKEFYDIYTEPTRKDKLRKQMPINIIMSAYKAYEFVEQDKLHPLDNVLNEMHSENIISTVVLRGQSDGAILYR